jgi:PPOX class probable F420-dependent enzyme
MSDVLTAEQRAFLAQPNPAVMATVAADGRPIAVATWYLLEDDGRVLLNFDAARTRLAHVRREPRIALDVLHADDWYRHLSLQLVVREIADDPDLDGIDRLSRLYTGDAYANRERPRVSAWADVVKVLDWGATTSDD